MQDTNGNYLTVNYHWGAGAGGGNSSARIANIYDSRPYYGPAYTFNYSAGHLASITNAVNTAEKYTMTYVSGQALVSPFTSASFGTTTLLQSVGTTGLGIATNFQYASSGEMTQMTTPLGGVLQWTYRGFTYGTGIAVREVEYRYMPMYANGSWGFWHDDAGDAGRPFHYITQVYDTMWSVGSKAWWFGTSPAGNLVVPTWQVDRTPNNGADHLARGFSWTTDAAGNIYCNSTTKYLNPTSPVTGYWSTSWPSTTTAQVVDTHGNLVQQQVYDYGAGSPTRTYNFTYLTDGNYTSRNIWNRLLTATVTDASGTTALVVNQYDQGTPAWVYYPTMHDTANYGQGFNYRGNVTRRDTGSGTATFLYAMTGVVTSTTAQGVTVSNSTSGATNYSLPEVVTPGGNGNLATSLSYNGSWSVTSVTGANGANATTTYDDFGRPSNSKIPDGATTTYSYTYNPNTQTATLAGRWTKTTLDGFGRPTKVETGNGGTTVSVAESEYAPCGCSPLGKVWRTARPHAPGASPQWTTYAYDGMGRTVAVTLPDGSVTRTEYPGNSVKTIDAAGKWKKHTTDAFGNLKVVTEPNPAGGEWTTSYTYDPANHLVRVEMPRPYNGGTYTQVRTFGYTGRSVPGYWIIGDKIASETNPETGTITYQYDGNGRLSARIDAKNGSREYSYDAYGRMTQKRHYNPSWGEDVGQRLRTRIDQMLRIPELHRYDEATKKLAALNPAYGDLGAIRMNRNADGTVSKPEGNRSPMAAYAVAAGPDGMLVRVMRLNTQVNWLDPKNQTYTDQSGVKRTYDLLAGMSADVGASSMTASQLMSVVVLHELGHAFGKVDTDTYTREVWNVCFK